MTTNPRGKYQVLSCVPLMEPKALVGLVGPIKAAKCMEQSLNICKSCSEELQNAGSLIPTLCGSRWLEGKT